MSGPNVPVGGMFTLAWYFISASRVRFPKNPFTVPSGRTRYPFDSRNVCSDTTSSPVNSKTKFRGYVDVLAVIIGTVVGEIVLQVADRVIGPKYPVVGTFTLP